MAGLFSSLSALVMGTVSAAKAVVTEIIPPAAALVGDIVATAAKKLKTDAANACAAASEKLIPSDGAPAVVSPMDSTPAQASAAEIMHEWSWFLHDRGVAVYVYALLALALLAVAFICGGVCALTLRSRLADQEDHGDRRRSHPQQRAA
jgi:hypothetical protein